jgi:hypothetical protein
MACVAGHSNLMAGRRVAVVLPRQRLEGLLPVIAGVLAITPAVYSQAMRLTLGLIAIPQGGNLRVNPAGKSLFEAGQNWPPAPWPTFPFWVSGIGLALVAVHLLRRGGFDVPYTMHPWVLAFWCGLSAGYAWVFGGLFRRSADWPRDSAFAVGLFLAEFITFTCLGFVFLHRKRNYEGKRKRACAEAPLVEKRHSCSVSRNPKDIS